MNVFMLVNLNIIMIILDERCAFNIIISHVDHLIIIGMHTKGFTYSKCNTIVSHNICKYINFFK